MPVGEKGVGPISFVRTLVSCLISVKSKNKEAASDSR